MSTTSYCFDLLFIVKKTSKKDGIYMSVFPEVAITYFNCYFFLKTEKIML